MQVIWRCVAVFLFVIGGAAEAQVRTIKHAKVESAGWLPQDMGEAHGWKTVPQAWRQPKAYTQPAPERPDDLPGRSLRVKVLEEGVVFVAATWAYDGNSDGGWKEGATTEQGMQAAGWQRVGTIDRLENKGKRTDQYVIFSRRLAKGATFEFYTRKYGPPYLLDLSGPDEAGVPATAAAPVASVTPGTAPTGGTPAASMPVGPLPSPAARLPVPGAGEQAAAKKLLEEVYADELKERSPATRLAFALDLLEKADGEGLEPAQRFLLLRTAGDVFVDVGNAEGAVAAARRLSAYFDLAELPGCVELLAKVLPNATTPERAAGLAEQCLALIEQVEMPRDREAAMRLAELGDTASGKARRPELRTELRALTSSLRAYRAEYEKVAPVLASIGEKTSDPAANLAAGRFKCFWELDWEGGLPLLALGSDPVLKDLAETDLQGPGERRQAADLGSVWWDRAEKEKDRVQQAMRQRAVHWYTLALPEASGLRKTLMEKRVAEAGEVRGFGGKED